jgi:ABC-type dipeptide/oligopeptide/nickel transport system permease subunit
MKFHYAHKLEAPSSAFPAGTDHLGRDYLARLLIGGRTSLVAGFLAIGAALIIGLTVGVTAGILGGAIEAAIMRLVDVVLAVPALIIALALIAALGIGPVTLVVAVAGAFWAVLARLARSLVMTARMRPDLIAAEMAGIPRWRAVLVHVVPGVAIEMAVVSTFNLAEVLGYIAGLSYLGLGVQPPDPEWGSMLNEAQPYFHVAPWLMYAPIFMIVLAVVAATLLASALRDAADPKVQIGRWVLVSATVPR